MRARVDHGSSAVQEFPAGFVITRSTDREVHYGEVVAAVLAFAFALAFVLVLRKM
jgi:hypothetical protein